MEELNVKEITAQMQNIIKEAVLQSLA